MSYDADALHGFAHDSIAQGPKSFALASRLFDRQTRERGWLLYAWCRAADDLVAGKAHSGAMRPGGGGTPDAKAAPARLDALHDRAYAGCPTSAPTRQPAAPILPDIALPRRLLEASH